MSSPDRFPPCESCLHNLHKAGVDESGPPEPTDLCHNELGVFHMLDCPLFLERPCTYYERAPEPHPVTADVAIDEAWAQLREDFLAWRYRRRVRALQRPRGWIPARLPVEVVADPEEPGDDVALAVRAPVAPPEPTTESLPQKPEQYPGQRRSEDRARKKREKLVAAARAAAVAAGIGQEMRFAATESTDAPVEPEPATDAAESTDEAPSLPPLPKTVDDVLASTPDAPVPGDRSGFRRARGPGDGRPADAGSSRRRRGRRRGRGPRESHPADDAPPPPA